MNTNNVFEVYAETVGKESANVNELEQTTKSISDMMKEMLKSTTPENKPPENKPPENKPPENKPPENKPPENKPPENKPPENQPTENKPPENQPPENKPPEYITKGEVVSIIKGAIAEAMKGE